jgi:AmiR/NasT family two-component response regulator
LNLFSDARISSEDIGVAEALATVATSCLAVSGELKAARQLAQQLQDALNSRIVIEQAKGVIAEKREVNMDTAFSLLRETARSAQVRLVDLASSVANRRLDVTEAIERVTGERG